MNLAPGDRVVCRHVQYKGHAGIILSQNNRICWDVKLDSGEDVVIAEEWLEVEPRYNSPWVEDVWLEWLARSK